MKGSLVWLQVLGLSCALVGGVASVVVMLTPPVLLEHPDPHPGASTLSISNVAVPILALGGGPAVAPAAAQGSIAPAISRSGLWIEAPELHIALPVRPGDGSNNIPLGAALVYPGTAAPGSSGNSYIYAHGYWDMFGGLLYARAGDTITLHDYDSGQSTQFTVSRVVGRISAGDSAWIHAPASLPTLTLQTCMGYSPSSDRYVVQAIHQG